MNDMLASDVVQILVCNAFELFNCGTKYWIQLLTWDPIVNLGGYSSKLVKHCHGFRIMASRVVLDLRGYCLLEPTSTQTSSDCSYINVTESMVLLSEMGEIS